MKESAMKERASGRASSAVYLLGGKGQPARLGSVDEMGFKASNLAAMASAGLPVPQGFVLSTGFCRDYEATGGRAPANLREVLAEGIRHIERESALVFGGRRKPLLVSVRSGAPVSMPGMMETVLDVGVNDETVQAMVRATGNPRLAWDCYRRLVQSFAEVVHDCPPAPFEARLARCLDDCGAVSTQEIDFRSLSALTHDFLSLFEEQTGAPFPQDPMTQLEAAALAVFRSWRSPRAASYRRAQGLDDAMGTAVTIQRMVFGNAGGMSGAGVAFTRDPSTGENTLYMDFLFNAQGEDVVAGRRTVGAEPPLGRLLPEAVDHLERVARILESRFQDAQEFEFTIEDGVLYLLQTRTAKCTPWAALRIAVEQVDAGLIEPQQALARLASIDLDSVQQTDFEDPQSIENLASATPAGLGIASGRIALDASTAVRWAATGDDVVLVRDEAATSDIEGIAASRGVLTAVGGRTAHAAVVARQLGKVCLVGCSELAIDMAARRCRVGRRAFAEGDWVCLDANEGRVLAGRPALVVRRPSEWLRRVEDWKATLRETAQPVAQALA
ncbi:MAG: PEP/pyruvate-binding domain-containing protein [Burkholderiales bacterium]